MRDVFEKYNGKAQRNMIEKDQMLMDLARVSDMWHDRLKGEIWFRPSN